MQTASAFAPGKIILFGEHAVVHGQPAIAVPLLTVGVTVEAQPAPPGTGLVVRLPENEEICLRRPQDAAGHPLYTAVIYPLELLLAALDRPVPDLALAVQATIPRASGLGSGAALAAALIEAAALALGESLPRDRLNALVYEVEKRHHGTPSGIDNTVIVLRQPVYFVRGAPLETPLIAAPFTLLVADTGMGFPTHVTVGDVGRLYADDPDLIGAVFKGIGDVVKRAREALAAGNIPILGTLMDVNHALLQRLTVSSAQLDDLCAAARSAGAWGAKLSGGGRGGNLIAVVAPEKAAAVTRALRDAGAARVIRAEIGAHNQVG